MHHPGARARVVDAHEGLTAAVAEEGDRALQVVPRPREIRALRIHGPPVHLGEAVAGRELHRIDEPRVVPGLHRRVRPPVEAVPHVAAVVESGGLLEHRPSRPQRQLHAPLHAVHEIHVAHHDGGAAVRVRRQREVHGRGGHPVVRDREVELDAEGGPGPAVGHLRELDGGIRVEHLRAVGLVHAAPEAAPEVGQHGDAQVLVLEVEGAPHLRRAPIGEVLTHGVRIVEAAAAEQVEGRVRIRRPFLVGRDRLRGLPDADVRRRRGGDTRRAHEERGQEPCASHLERASGRRKRRIRSFTSVAKRSTRSCANAPGSRAVSVRSGVRSM